MPLSSAVLCLVIAISDGDTLKARCNNEPVIIRLAEIDAPEERQAFGKESTESLRRLCLNKKATINAETVDRYGRTVARVNCGGTDASAEQVKRGMAWVFDRFATDQELYALQNDARTKKRGLWRAKSPTPPWEWRKNK